MAMITTPTSDNRTIAAGAAIALVGRLSGRALHMAGQVVLARVLGPAVFGVYAIGWTLFRIASVLAPLGLNHGVIKFAHYGKEGDSDTGGVFVAALAAAVVFGGMIGAGLWVLAPWLAEHAFRKDELTSVIRMFAIGLPLFAGLRIAASTTRISQTTKYAAVSADIVYPAAALALIGLAYKLDLGLEGAAGATPVSAGLAFVLALYFVHRVIPGALRPAGPIHRHLRGLVVYSLPTALATTFSTLTIWVDRLMVGIFRTSHDVGIYQAASQTSVIFTLVVAAFSAIFTPVIADLHAKGEIGRIAAVYRTTTKWVLYVCLPAMLVLLAAPTAVLGTVFGPSYREGALVAALLAIGQMGALFAGPVGFLLIMVGRQNRWFVLSMAAAIACVILDLLLIPRFGIVGAAVGTCIATLGLQVAGVLEARRVLGSIPFDRGLAVTWMIGLAGWFVLRVLQALLSGPDGLHLIVVTVVAVVGFIGAMVAKGLEDDDREIIRVARRRMLGVIRGAREGTTA